MINYKKFIKLKHSDIQLKSNDEFEESLEQRMGSAIASRLNEMCEVIHVFGRDMRGQGQTFLKNLQED